MFIHLLSAWSWILVYNVKNTCVDRMFKLNEMILIRTGKEIPAAWNDISLSCNFFSTTV